MSLGFRIVQRDVKPSATLVVDHLSDGRVRCTDCGRYLAPEQFESKGQRAGRQVRRRKCRDCDALRRIVFAPRDDVDGGTRECKVCGRRWAIIEYRRCGTYGEYRLWKCRLCLNTYARAYYAKRKWQTHKGLVKRHRPYPYRPMRAA